MVEKEIAILMADLTGYTAMTDVHGGASAARMVSKYMEIVDTAIHGTTQLVQRIGDQVVMIAVDPSDLLETVKRLNTLTREEHHFLSIHAGLHFGNILIEKDNLFGSTINIAARIMNAAGRGQILCSSDFVNSLPPTSQVLFKSLGIQRLKNLMNDLELFELTVSPETKFHIDPVCHMHVDSTKTSISEEHRGITYHFCSEQCRLLFHQTPERFI